MRPFGNILNRQLKANLLILLLLGFTASAIWAQTIVNQYPTEYLVKELFLGKTAGITITNITYKGHPNAIGAFYSNVKNLPVQKGIIMSTGSVQTTAGPNQNNSTTTEFGTRGDSGLSALSGFDTYDAAVLSITFTAEFDHIEFQYFFASEEYPEYVNKGVNDVFAFLISGAGYPVTTNIAVLPGTNLPVSVDNINHLQNEQLFHKNYQWTPSNYDYLAQNPLEGDVSNNFQFDGYTTLLTANATVTPQQPYTLTMAIADAGDNAFDSGVIIKANSFVSKPQPPPTSPLRQLSLITDTVPRPVTDSLTIMAPIYFAHNATTPDTSSWAYLTKVAKIMSQNPQISLIITGYTDSTGTDAYNLQLSEKRALSIKKTLTNMGVQPQSITPRGLGKAPETQPFSKNRRVEFTFVYKP